VVARGARAAGGEAADHRVSQTTFLGSQTGWTPMIKQMLGDKQQ
jgi:hypothetical protein